MRRLPPDWAHEFATVDYTRRLAGVTLLGELLAAAEARGIHRFVAYVLVDNRRMLGLLMRHTDVRARSVDSGVVTLILGRKAA